ncbi:MAG: NAD(P)/FAD-dependent oxidoreductase [Anaerococcus sp.]|uniref:NAD(P)/FAD-dependent oxidoreductase n=2 Tax=Anaerococcus sp. TaxID=1872515 RepID=UPI002623FD8C|nr:NAD(P)/FAD-dependent oxidoreductase [Anaerococcus sp.]MCI5971952.1 NAD(P)/FAD-dependent oxidoreductase [Anaerococcus sp.]MDD6918778.1 NAD(P)/FAD-dependent oxidoreductase [Peptoniphilaceae bacterium]
MRKIGIIGAGPAGVFAAINIKNENNQVYLLDKNNQIGEKLKITGNGRCNVTNANYYDEFLENIIRNKNFLYSAFSRFDNFSMIDFLNKEGIETVIEEDDKVFPKSSKSSEIICLFESLIREKGIRFIPKTEVEKIEKSDCFLLETSRGKYEFDSLIIATGGRTYPKTGSTGDGYTFARSFGHKIINTKASLMPLYLEDRINVKALSLSDKKLCLKTKEKTYEIRGDIMLTPNFITGPAALKIQALAARDHLKILSIDFLPEYTYEMLDKKLISIFEDNSRKNLSNVLNILLNDQLVSILIDRLKINKDMKVSEVSREDRKRILDLMKAFDLKISQKENFNNAVITSGGVDLKEINPKTMESKLVKDLYFIGEVLDIDALTGGFNLQIAFTTAYAASLAIKEKI